MSEQIHNMNRSSFNQKLVYILIWPFRTIFNMLRPYLLIMPALAILLVLIIYPLIFSLQKSLTDYNLALPGEENIGLQNYRNALEDPDFLASLKVSTIFSLAATGTELVLGMATALLLRREFRGKRVVTILLMLPMMVTPVVVGIIWLLMFQPDFSVINGVLAQIGIEGPIWLQKPTTARIAIIVADVWQWTPFFTLVLLSGLLNLPIDLIEAAKVDGASNIQAFRLITIPMLMPLIMVVVLIRLIDSFKTFDSIFIMTNGGPGTSTSVLSLHIYRTGLPYMDIGYASAMSYIFLIILTIITMLLIRQLRRA